MSGDCDRSDAPYPGSAPYYRQGRLPYPSELTQAAARALGLDGHGRLLDLGCGPGIIALRLAHCFDQIVGIDADEAMIDQARRSAAADGIGNARFYCMRAESLPADLGQFRAAALALSFHWFDQPRVANALMRMLEPGGACMCVYGWTLRGDAVIDSENPRPPYAQMMQLVDHYLGPAGTVKHPATPSVTPGDEAPALTAAGFSGPQITTVSGGEIVTTTIDDIIARYYSTSGTSPRLLGNRLPDYERDARALLSAATPTGQFTEQLRDLQLNVWTRQPAH